MKRTTTNVLLSIITLAMVVVAVNTMGKKADAQPQAGGGNPYIVKFLVQSQFEYYRVWSDGQVDRFSDSGFCDYEQFLTEGPVEHPFPVVDAKFGEQHGNCASECMLKLTYGDGRVDIVGYQVSGDRCTIAGVGTPSFCSGDVDRNGIVGIEDFLIVLAQWDCQ